MCDWHISIPCSLNHKECRAPEAQTERPQDARIVAIRLRYCRSGNRSGSEGWTITNVGLYDKQQIGADENSALAVIAAHATLLASRGAMGDLKSQVKKNPAEAGLIIGDIMR